MGRRRRGGREKKGVKRGKEKKGARKDERGIDLMAKTQRWRGGKSMSSQ